MPQQSFELDNQGQTIRGTCYLPAGSGRFPTVVFYHGFTGMRIEGGFLFVQLARRLNQAGIAAITFDFRNSGESDGSFDQMLVTGELSDGLRVSQWAASQVFVDRSRMGLFGFSLGGLLASCTVARTPIYKALMLAAPTTERNLSRIAKTRVDAQGRLVVGAYYLRQDFIDDLLTLDCVSDVVKNPRPTLLVQGDADTAVPPPISQQLVDAMNEAGVPVEHVMIPGAEHVFATPEHREALYDTIVKFAVKYL